MLHVRFVRFERSREKTIHRRAHRIRETLANIQELLRVFRVLDLIQPFKCIFRTIKHGCYVAQTLTERFAL